jgi:tetratricopeptide (TPR) repeat protein
MRRRGPRSESRCASASRSPPRLRCAARSSDARSTDAHYLGNLCREQHRYAEAVIAYEGALALVPSHPSILNNLGLALEGADQPDRARQCYRDALLAQPRHRQALGNLAHLLTRQREYPEALRHCEAYLATFPDPDPTVLVDHGICLQHHLHDPARAEASYRRAAALAPDDATSLLNLGALLMERDDCEEAVAVLARAVAIDPQQLNALTLLALPVSTFARGTDSRRCTQIAGRLERGAGEHGPANPFALLSMPVPASAQLRAEGWARFWSPAQPSAPPSVPGGARAGAQAPTRLSVVGLSQPRDRILLSEVWERHDRTRFETAAYSIRPARRHAAAEADRSRIRPLRRRVRRASRANGAAHP